MRGVVYFFAEIGDFLRVASLHLSTGVYTSATLNRQSRQLVPTSSVRDFNHIVHVMHDVVVANCFLRKLFQVE